MSFLYEIFIKLYAIGIRLASIFNSKGKKWIIGRKNSFENLKSFASQNPKNIWVHCASTGEFEQGIPLIEKLRKDYPTHTILISFFSPSGYEYAQKKYSDWHIIYLPIDTKKNAQKWISILKPQLAIFVKYEFWHFYFHAIKKAGIPLLMVSAVFWEELFFFKNYASFFRKSLRQVTHFFVQNQESKRLLNDIKITNVSVTGDTRFERTLALKNTPFSDKKIEKFINKKNTLIVGSAWDSDIKIIQKLIDYLPPDWKIIIAPHELNHFSYNAFKNVDSIKYSENLNNNARLLFLDTMGLLSKTYRFAAAVYVGGGYGKGIHNILEAAVYNIPIFSGPNMQRFDEAKKLAKLGVLKVLPENKIVKSEIEAHLYLSEKIKVVNTQFFAEMANVSEQIMVFIKKQDILY